MENIPDSDNPVVKWHAVLLKMASIADVFLWVLWKCSGDLFYGKTCERIPLELIREYTYQAT